MRTVLFLLVFAIAASTPANSSPKIDFDFSKTTIADLATIVYRDLLPVNYVLEPEIIEDKRLVSVRFTDFRVKENWVEFLDSLGYRLEVRGKTDYIQQKTKKADDEIYIYRPKFKKVDDLKVAFSGLFSGTFTNSTKELVFKGSAKEIEQLKKHMKIFDIREKELIIKGYVYEVSHSKTDGSSIQLIGDILKNAGFAIVNGVKMPNVLSFKNADFDMAVSFLSTDNRFKIISSPYLRVRNNTKAKLVVGKDVPTMGAVVYDGTQSPIQSIEYRSSGVIFEIFPEILGDVVNLEVNQELSDFSETSNGVNNSPTLIKRQIATNISAVSGEIILLGGLTEDKNTDTSSGLSFFPKFLGAKNKSADKSEIVLLLKVEVL